MRALPIVDKIKGIFSPGAAQDPKAGKKRPRGSGSAGPIGVGEIRKAAETMREYKSGKTSLEARIIANQRWYKMRHWEQIRKKEGEQSPYEAEPTSAWMFNSIANKHADAMDNYPVPAVLPREESDKTAAEELSRIIPVILENNNFEQTYSDTWWYKLVAGAGIYGVFWNPSLENGLGDVDIKKIDALNTP